MKKFAYYASFIIAGLGFGFLVHALLELEYLKLLLTDFNKFGFGWSWSTWENIHTYGTLGLTLGFGWLGYMGGKKYWRILYIEQRYQKLLGKLKTDF